MIKRKAYIVELDNGLSYDDNHIYLVGIYSLDNLEKAREDGKKALLEMGGDSIWYHDAYITIEKIPVDGIIGDREAVELIRFRDLGR